jgi:hypothetical protein
MSVLALLRTRQWLPLVGALLLVSATAVPALARMTCLNSGHSELWLGNTGGCCPQGEHEESATVQATCCEVVKAQPKGVVFVHHPAIMLPMPAALPDDRNIPSIAVPELASVHGTDDPRPPPTVTGRRLAIIGRLTI